MGKWDVQWDLRQVVRDFNFNFGSQLLYRFPRGSQYRVIGCLCITSTFRNSGNTRWPCGAYDPKKKKVDELNWRILLDAFWLSPEGNKVRNDDSQQVNGLPFVQSAARTPPRSTFYTSEAKTVQFGPARVFGLDSQPGGICPTLRFSRAHWWPHVAW